MKMKKMSIYKLTFTEVRENFFGATIACRIDCRDFCNLPIKAYKSLAMSQPSQTLQLNLIRVRTITFIEPILDLML